MKLSNFLARVCVIAVIVSLTGSAGHQMKNHCPNEQEILPCLCKSRGSNVLVSCRRSSLEELNIIFSVLAKRVSQIEELMLEENDIAEIPVDTFINLPVQKLLLWNNGLLKIANQSFNGLSQHLTELHIRERSLSEVPTGVLDSLLSLEKLIIERTPLVQLPSLIFCQSLRTLHIDETLVGEISHGAFVDLPRLKVVQITNSLLKNFQDRAFLNLPALELLNLTGNHLSIINPSGWAQLPQLKVVDVRNNKLREIYSIFSMLSNFKKLKALHFDHNQITNIDVAFEAFTFPELNAFTISYNLIEHFVSAQYKNWPSLRFLDLSFNQLPSFPLSLLAKTPLLEDLSLAGNPLMRSSFDVRISSILSELPRLRLLNLDHCGIIKITQQTIGFHPVLEHLSLRNNSLRNIEAGAFHRLPSLAILNLSQNQLSNIPRDPRFSHTLSPVAALSGVFWHLEKLQSLDLSSNQLGNIDSTFFASLPSLRILNVSRNALTHIDSRVWTQMPSIDHMDLSHNSLNSLDGRMCKHLIHLERFIASFNQLSRVESGELHCPKLRFLDLSSNTIAVISDEAFAPHNALQFLDLSQNILPAVPNLNHLGFLRTISLASNWIDHLRSADFEGNLILDTINLSKNQIRKLPIEYFTNAHHLRNVDLSHNAIQLLPANVFRNLMNLDKLDISFNRIAEVEADAFHPSTTLRSLNLAHNNISHLSNDGIDLEALQILDLQNNRISELSHFSVQKMRSLSELNLSSNDITTVNTKAFETSRALIKIDLSNNKIQKLSSNAFSSLPNLQLLKLGRNQIERVEDDTFYDLVSLESLELEENLIQHIAKDAFHGPSLLRMLNLSCNAFKRIDDAGINNFLSLEVLDLSFNRINEINGRSFRRLSQLLHLNMENNTICRLAEDSLKTQQKLRSLSLRNNLLRFLPESSLQQDLLHLDLGGNPLNCDCQLLWLFEKSSIIINRTTENYIFKQSKHDQTESTIKKSQLRLDLNPLDDFENCISLPRRLSRSICQARELKESYDFCDSTISTERPQTTASTVPNFNAIPKSPVINHSLLHEVPTNKKNSSLLGNVPTVYAEIRKHNSSSTPEKTVATGGSSLLGPLKIGLNFLPALIGVGSLVSGIMNKQGQQNKQEKDLRTTQMTTSFSSASLKNPNFDADKPTRGPDRHKLPWAQISSADYINPQYSTTTVTPTQSANNYGIVNNRPSIQTRRPYIPLNFDIHPLEENLKTLPPYDSGYWIPAPPIPLKSFTPTSPMKQQTSHQGSVWDAPNDIIKSTAATSSQAFSTTTLDTMIQDYDEFLYIENNKESDNITTNTEDIYYDIIDEVLTSASPPTTPIPVTTEDKFSEEIETHEENSAFSLQKLLSSFIQGRHTSELPKTMETEGIGSHPITTFEPSILKRDSTPLNLTALTTESNQVLNEILPADDEEIWIQFPLKETHEDGLNINNTLTENTYVVSNEVFLNATKNEELKILFDDDPYKEWIPTLYEINSDLTTTNVSSKVAKSHAKGLFNLKSQTFYSNPFLFATFLITFSSLTNRIVHIL